MTEEVVICTVKNGYISNLKRVTDIIAAFEGAVEVIIRKKKKYRSSDQNRYLHKLFRIFAEELKASPKNPYPAEVVINEDLVKSILKYKFARHTIANTATGEVIDEFIQDTSDMSTTEIALFVEQIIEYAATTYHIQLPFPNEQIELPPDEQTNS